MALISSWHPSAKELAMKSMVLLHAISDTHMMISDVLHKTKIDVNEAGTKIPVALPWNSRVAQTPMKFVSTVRLSI